MTDCITHTNNVDIRWCSLSEYGNDNFPCLSVIAPGAAERLTRWQSVLGQYVKECASDKAWAWPLQSTAQVLSLSPELEAAARTLARLFKAHFIQAQSEISTSGPLYVFGKPNDFTHRVVQTLRDRATQTSFLPAIDLAGASFIAAKLVLSSLSDEPEQHLCCDVILGQPADYSTLITSRDDTGHATSRLGAVIVQAHGDGAHTNAGNVVICGRVGEVERLSDGGSIPGCERRADGDHCKRRGPKHAGICVLQDLRARNLVLFSCNAFTIGDGQYPSTSNLVVAALDGYASGVVATHVSYLPNPDEIVLAKDAARDKVPAFALYMKLRGLRRTLNSLDPFVYAGLIKADASLGLSQQNEPEIDTETASELGEALAAWQQHLTRVGQRFIEHLSALRLISLKEGMPTPGGDADTFRTFEAHVSSYVALLHAFLSEAESWLIHRSNYENVLRLLHQVIQHGKECDVLLAKNLLARFRNSDYALGEFGKRKSGWKATGVPCAYCGNDQVKTTLTSFLFPQLSGHRLSCPACGVFEIALPSAGRLTISAKTTWHRGDTLQIEAALRPGGRQGRLWKEVGWGAQFGFHITHYGHVPYLSKLVTPAPGEKASADFECPADMHPDIYSITVAAVLGGCISVKRLRTLCL
jgi:hypothetical protein